MNSTNMLIFIAISAWILQIGLGWWQVSRFNNAFQALCKKGNVGVGKSKGRFKPKVIIAVAFDSNLYVTDAILMKGFSVFSQPQSMENLIGLHYDNIDPITLFSKQIAYQEALTEAIKLK
ncbi:DNA-binding transcriptional activator GutM [Phocoenobacter uteri]|uniref:DNA-binding transcriptional activator GutM n=1 Tax=Phocoenobacter uteri TaxID=146806 RepID=A0A379CC26_9PAST|nr:transcriptional regulator GutM [Phocoenobacter uteri]MDG6881833.1 XRE family transcriptional regulator [Phocoenobacter uteri]SUB59870.1 DNA-binding transcriptional activator GutM [Phocoenobacter uteri]